MVARDQRDGGAAARLLVLGAGPAQLGLLAAAHKRELHVIAVDRDPDAPGFRYADRRAIISTEDEVGIERLAEAERVDGVIAPGIDWPVGIAARVASKLGLAHPLSPESAVLATQDFPHGVVRVVDSRSTAMGLGFAVLAAARLAGDGGSAAEVQGAATAKVDATVNGQNTTIAFNSRFIADALGSLTASEVRLELGGPLAPGVVKIVGDESYLHVVMPLRIPA